MSGAKQASTTEATHGHAVKHAHADNHGRSLPRSGAARQLLAGGASVSVLGILLSLGSPDGVGGAVGRGELAGALFVLGSGILLLGLHRVGRLGPE